MTHILRATYLSGRHHQHDRRATVPPVLPAKDHTVAAALPAAVLIPCITKLIHTIRVTHPPPNHSCQFPQARHCEQAPVDGFPRGNAQPAQGGASRLFPVLCKWDLTAVLSASSELPAAFHSGRMGWFQGSKVWI